MKRFQCVDCIHYSEGRNSDSGEFIELSLDDTKTLNTIGTCCKNAPAVGDTVDPREYPNWPRSRDFGRWPNVQATDWCSEFQLRPGLSEDIPDTNEKTPESQ